MSNTFDLLQTFKSVDIPTLVFWKMILFRVPYLFSEVVSIVCFVSTFLFFRHILLTNEMIILASNGIANWRIFLLPIIGNSFLGFVVLLL